MFFEGKKVDIPQDQDIDNITPGSTPNTTLVERNHPILSTKKTAPEALCDISRFLTDNETFKKLTKAFLLILNMVVGVL